MARQMAATMLGKTAKAKGIRRSHPVSGRRYFDDSGLMSRYLVSLVQQGDGEVSMLLACSAYIIASLVLSNPGIHTERVFGPEIPGKYKHPASITELDNGDLYLVYYGGSGEYAGDSAVFGARLPKGESKWSRPDRITPKPHSPEGNA